MEDLGGWAFRQWWELRNISWRIERYDDWFQGEDSDRYFLCVGSGERPHLANLTAVTSWPLTKSRRTSSREAGEEVVHSEGKEKRTCLVPFPLLLFAHIFFIKMGFLFLPLWMRCWWAGWGLLEMTRALISRGFGASASLQAPFLWASASAP